MGGKYLRYVRQNRNKIGFVIIILIFLIALEIFVLHTLIQPNSPLIPPNNTVYVAGDGSGNLTGDKDNQAEINQTIQSNFSLVPSNTTVYVASDGSGNFTCDGSDDQVEINKALAYIAENPQFTTVHLKGPNTYVISNSIFIGSDTVLEGDPTAVIKLEDKAEWPSGKPLITQMDSAGNHDIIIRGFEIYGNHDNNKDKRKGEGYYNLIHFLNSKNIQVHDMYMHDGHGDGLRVESSSYIQFYNNKVYKLVP